MASLSFLVNRLHLQGPFEIIGHQRVDDLQSQAVRSVGRIKVRRQAGAIVFDLDDNSVAQVFQENADFSALAP